MEGIWTIVVTSAVCVVAALGTTWFGHWLGLSKDRALRLEPKTTAEEFYKLCLDLGRDPWDARSNRPSVQQVKLPR
ncbi:hypothetical protein FHP25_07750 [Vineibacter terrae]|uniref:Uncharacterized protein n=1 Tax=Vineibacter terrae TaxID=2586908 RepID=A0A5C8PR98_9HYPH|nr:hypothetical protein [Vineibacter terrae]TXL78090.1 hypothetical protein FHP25_07750 [Vineibacter terrae]